MLLKAFFKRGSNSLTTSALGVAIHSRIPDSKAFSILGNNNSLFTAPVTAHTSSSSLLSIAFNQRSEASFCNGVNVPCHVQALTCFGQTYEGPVHSYTGSPDDIFPIIIHFLQ